MIAAPPGWDVGCDVAAVDEVADSLALFGERYLRRVFTPGEVRDTAGAAPGLAARFAAKEAVIKLFRDPTLPAPLTEIEVVSVAGLPELRLHGALAAAAALRWDELAVSLSHAGCHALAVVLARRR